MFSHCRLLSLRASLPALFSLCLPHLLSLPALIVALPARADAPDIYAIKGARVAPVVGAEIPAGTVVLRQGRITAVGADDKVTIPADATIIEGKGLVVYPALIDAASSVGLARAPGAAPPQFPAEPRDIERLRAQLAAERAAREAAGPSGYGSRLNGVAPETRAADTLRTGGPDWTLRRQLGFGAALVVPQGGIFAGTSALALLCEGDATEALLRPDVAAHLNLGGGRGFGGGYPTSLMGIIAAARQTLSDARWHQQTISAYAASSAGRERVRLNRAWEALAPVMSGERPLVLSADSSTEIPRALKLAGEFGLKPLIEGAGEAQMVADTIKAAGATLLLGVNFPAPLRDVTKGNAPSLQTLRRRALAVKNAAALHKAGVPFAFTTNGLENPGEFLPNVRKAVEAGLPREAALAAMTIVPARVLGAERELGSIEAGKIANLIVADGDLFDAKTKLRRVFIDGKAVVLPAAGQTTSAPTPREMRPGLPPAGARDPGARNPGQRRGLGRRNRRPVAAPPSGNRPDAVSTPAAEEAEDGEEEEAPPAPQTASGTVAQAAPQDTPKANATPAAKAPDIPTGPVPAPAETTLRTVLLKSATVWTAGPQGILKNCDVLLQNGAIAGVGPSLKAPAGAVIVDARGKHVTPGLIDCHSHTAIAGGVNEGTNIVTAEVRIRDVINPEDVGIYRQLAGGLTAANLLHGSANAIGGQNAVIKLRWGNDADGLLYASAPQGIKFALGENPTRNQSRYPNTRMGMEQVYRERFLAALDYKRKWADFRAGKTPDEPRRDFQLDAIVEILEGKRLIHCHGYRQDEFLMLMRLCEEFGVRIATFQHVLEGYKVADEMARHGAGGSTFSDWWAFKVEAADAIPYNGALMAERGVLVSFNSDNGDLARRMNLEAAKAVKWGGMTPHEALKFVTINPAKQLGIGGRTGSLEVGKDADVAVWSGDPLSVYSKCEMTFVEGVRRFDRAADLAQRPKIEAERRALLEVEGVKLQEAGGRRQEALTPGPSPKLGRGELECSESGVRAGSRTQQNGNSLLPPASRLPPPASLFGPVTAIIGATVHPVSGPDIPNGVVVMQGQKIIAVGAKGKLQIPRGAQVVNAAGLHLYPGLIDAHTTLGLNEIGSLPVTQDYREAGDFNPNVRAEIAVNPASTAIPVARANGVLAAAALPEGGRIAGHAALLQLAGWTWEDLAVKRGLGLVLRFPAIGEARERRGPGDDEHAGHAHGPYDLCESEWTWFDRDDGLRALSGEAMAQGAAQPTAPAAPPTPPPAPPAVPAAPETPAVPPEGTPPEGAQPPRDRTQPEGQQPATTEKRDEAREAQREPDDDPALEPLNRAFDEAERYRKSVAAGGVADTSGSSTSGSNASGSNANAARAAVPLSDRDVKLAAMLPVLEGREPLLARVANERQIRAALAWAKRRKLRLTLIVDNENAIEAATDVKAAGVPLILGPTLSYPERPDSPYDITYTFPARLREAGINFALSSGGDASNVRRLPYQAAMAACFGLPHEAALRAITLDAATILGVADRLGSIEPGKDATLIVTTADPLEITTQIKMAWIGGEPVNLSNKHLQLYETYKARPKKPASVTAKPVTGKP